MFRSGLSSVALFFAFGVASADARLSSATLPEPDDSAIAALHKPTGCQAQVVLRGGAFLKAQITDPECLPKGIKARDIPGTRFDFLVTPK